MNNLQLLAFSFKNPEPIIDDFYVKDGSLLIAENPQKPTTLM